MLTIASRAESGAAARARLIKRRPKIRRRPKKRRKPRRKRRPRKRRRLRKRRRPRKRKRPRRRKRLKRKRRLRRRRRPRRRLPLIRKPLIKLLLPPPLPELMLTSVFLLPLKVQDIASQASVALINIQLTLLASKDG